MVKSVYKVSPGDENIEIIATSLEGGPIEIDRLIMVNNRLGEGGFSDFVSPVFGYPGGAKGRLYPLSYLPSENALGYYPYFGDNESSINIGLDEGTGYVYSVTVNFKANGMYPVASLAPQYGRSILAGEFTSDGAFFKPTALCPCGFCYELVVKHGIRNNKGELPKKDILWAMTNIRRDLYVQFSFLYKDILYWYQHPVGGFNEDIEIELVQNESSLLGLKFLYFPNIYEDSIGTKRLVTHQYSGGIYDAGGDSGSAGGEGSFTDGPSDNIAATIPNGTVEANSSSVGLFTRYAMNVGQMQALAEKIYADNFLEKLGLEVTKFLWNSPIDAIISCQTYPFSVTSLVGYSSVHDIKLGAVPTGLSGSALAGSAAKIDWGSIRLEEYWKNFLDYAPHTKIELYLPWSTGFVEIDPHECLPGSISVVTNIEFGKGTCQHIVTGNNGAVIGVFSGVCATTLPLTSIDTASKAINVVTAAAGLAVAAATGGAATSAGIAAGIARGSGATLTAKEFATHVAGTKAAISAAERPYKAMQGASLKVAAQSSVAAFRQPPHVVRNGSFNGNGAGMGIQYPFIILSRPTQSVPKNYGHYYGYPSNIYTTLGSVSGYTEVAAVHLDGISCTGQEREEIDNLLKGGVIL